MTDTETPESRTGPRRPDLTPPRTFNRDDRARASLPSREQMKHLIERAERNVLTPAEAHLLRAGFAHLVSQLEQAGVLLAQLRGELDEARGSSPLAVACPFCRVEPGVRCRALRGVQVPATPHVARIEAAKRLVFAQALGEAS